MSYQGFSDFRSDTVTRPTEEMKKAMMNAELGDDVHGDDPTVIELENLAAEMMDKEAALFVPSGTMGNTIALIVGAGPGKGVIMEEKCHIFNFEAGNVSRMAGSLPHILPSHKGEIPLQLISGSINTALREHMPETKAITLENTHNVWGGTTIGIEYLQQVKQIAHQHKLHFHLDGARIFNASIALNVPVAEIARCFDSLMFCLSKGLAAPIGSLLVGTKDFIKEARIVRKYLGGGMRQVGIIAAAGIYAIKNLTDRLAEDHIRAKKLALAITDFDQIKINPDDVETNMLRITLKGIDANTFLAKLAKKKVLALPFSIDSIRFVTHKDIDDQDIDKAIGAIGSVLGR